MIWKYASTASSGPARPEGSHQMERNRYGVPNGTNLSLLVSIPMHDFLELSAWFIQELIVFRPAFSRARLNSAGS
ncbi:MAG TPA: hypothetical protein VM658_01395, partial [bacterium]|nr:hypothetical protein [bacterium]